MPSWKVIVTTASGVTAVAGALAVFGVDEIPRPAFASEVIQLAGEVTELDSRVTSQQLDDAKLQLYQNRREQVTAEREHNAIPLFLLEEQTVLERRIDNLQHRLQKLRGE